MEINGNDHLHEAHFWSQHVLQGINYKLTKIADAKLAAVRWSSVMDLSLQHYFADFDVIVLGLNEAIMIFRTWNKFPVTIRFIHTIT